MDTTAAPPKSKHKAFEYATALRWTGDRNGVLAAEGKPPIEVSSPPEFKGKAGQWTPEDLLVASVEICTMTTFIAFSYRRELGVLSYESSASGTMEFADGRYRFTRIVLRPRITVGCDDDIPRAAAILDEAHHGCFIANSICGRVTLEPIITTGTPCSSEPTIPPVQG